MEINREELAWAAGFFDGEGCTCMWRPASTSRVRRPYPRLSVAQTSVLPLMRFQKAVGGLGSIYRLHRNTKSGKVVWAWQANRWRDVQAVIAMLWTFLSLVKQEQASRVWTEWTENAA